MDFETFFGDHFHGPQAFSMTFEVTRILISSNGSEKLFEMLPGMVWEPSYEQKIHDDENFVDFFFPDHIFFQFSKESRLFMGSMRFESV